MKLPYLPEGREILYVSEENEFMQAAKQAAEELSTDGKHRTGVVIVRDGEVLGRGANASGFHKHFGCVRKKLKAPTGKWYFFCPGCSTRNHAEQTAIRAAGVRTLQSSDSDLYLWGHWWCCESCWEKMIQVGIRHVFLAQGAERLFRK